MRGTDVLLTPPCPFCATLAVILQDECACVFVPLTSFRSTMHEGTAFNRSHSRLLNQIWSLKHSYNDMNNVQCGMGQ